MLIQLTIYKVNLPIEVVHLIQFYLKTNHVASAGFKVKQKYIWLDFVFMKNDFLREF
jgi:hypothetical protein